MSTLRLGTRGSRLALRQTEIAMDALRQTNPAISVEVVAIESRGDDVASGPAWRADETGIFTSRLTRELIEGRIDAAVHSLKDLPVQPTAGTRIGAVLRREDPRDALVGGQGRSLAELPAGARVGTSSLRRRAHLLGRRPDLCVREIRGNVLSRLAAAGRGDYDAIIVALAGLARLDRADQVSEVFDADDWLPAAGQGAIALEIRDGDGLVAALAASIDDRDTRFATVAERTLVSALGAGCRAPVSALAARDAAGAWWMTAEVSSLDGRARIRTRAVTRSADEDSARALGARAAAQLRERGADALLAAARLEMDDV